MPMATVNDRPLFFADTGGDGPVLLLGHGYFLDHSTFSPQAAVLAPTWRLITWDARGHGQTPDDDPGTSYTYWDQARDALGLLDHLGIERAVAGGLSQGGFTALRIALLAPERVAGLVLWDTEATPCDPADKAAYGGMFAALREYGPIDDLIVPLSTQLLGESDLRDELRARWRAEPALPLGPAAHCLLERDDVSPRLNEITCPALLMWGEQDVSLPRDRMDLLSERLPNAGEVHVIRGAAHTPTLTHPEQVNPLLQQFLQTLA
ncbi:MULTISPECIES: alpha/beta fold hydrolase [unclassified Amycolatopsis]|uniref:alpha/beta fold hydrolase n=1 Tax=unclassified Amycolatopsis TaxID=2618356 RepID=UPI00055A31B6|nr:alpha/beta hydrolase [Amycolatopsis sp. Poz14]MCG3756964.1 alpha/beta hydrolase [Amycolatopsis sp. Poz14]